MDDKPIITTTSDLDPMGDLADAFNNVTTLTFEDECKRLKEINKRIQTKLNQTERELEKFKENVKLSCDEMLRILRDGENYGHTEDYTEKK
tara:strand:+ start:279 stop:551 length:273 start_codon:yes stop_codon:yes gene_type:complete